MQGRSRMAALTLVAGIALTLATPAQAVDKLVVSEVRLELRIAGLRRGGDGCDVEVKPGHAGCKFQKVTQHVTSDGVATVKLKNVESTGSDHDCAFTITVKESGHPDKTIHRGMRLNPPEPGKLATVPTLSCFVSAPSKIAAAEKARTRR